MRICCIQHSERVRPQGVADWAAARGHELDIVRIDLGEALPNPADVTALVVLGGGMNTDEAQLHPWLDIERAWLRQVLATGEARVLGICLGAQLLAEVLGGSVGRAPEREVGWHRIALTAEGRRSPLLGTLPDEFDAFQWHGDAWTLPPGAELVATGADGSGICQTQAFTWKGRVMGVQFHPEFTYERTTELAASTTEDLTVGGLVQFGRQFLAQPERFSAMHGEVQDPLLDTLFGAPAAE